MPDIQPKAFRLKPETKARLIERHGNNWPMAAATSCLLKTIGEDLTRTVTLIVCTGTHVEITAAVRKTGKTVAVVFQEGDYFAAWGFLPAEKAGQLADTMGGKIGLSFFLPIKRIGDAKQT